MRAPCAPWTGYATTDVTDPFLGTQVARYRIVRLLGEGGMGRVYLAVHPEIGSRVAIKVLSAPSVSNPELVQRFFDEARAVNLIAHDHIVSIMDLDRLPNGTPYIVMEYVHGNTLRTLVDQGPLPVAGLLRVGTEVLQALDAVHAAGIVHRDLKPDNVMVTLTGHAKVLDFGIAKLTRDRTTDTPRTRTGAMVGTPDYMAPEQIRGWAVDARTDLYAVGLLLYEAATGVRPFTGDSDFEVMDKHLREEAPDPRALRPDLPSPLSAVILAALNKAPNQRFQSARAMGNALAAITPGTFVTWDALASQTWRADAVPLDVDLRNAPTIGERPARKPKQRDTNVLRYVLIGAIVASACAITYAIARRPSAPSEAPAAYEPPPAPPKAVAAIDAGMPADAFDWVAHQEVQIAAGWPSFPTKLDPDARKMAMFAKDYDPATLDPTAYLPRAIEHARAAFPDAQLHSIGWFNVTAEGRIDFSLDRSAAVYRFESETARRAGPVKQACQVVLALSAYGISVSFDDECEGLRVNLRCTAAEIHARLQALGMPREIPISITLYPHGPGRPAPTFSILADAWNREEIPRVPNDCRP